MKRVINAVVQIEYEEVPSQWNDLNQCDKDEIAINMAIKPNMASETCGILLKSVAIDQVEPYKIIDWDKLQHNPDQLHLEH